MFDETSELKRGQGAFEYREAVDWLLGSLEPLLARPIPEVRERP
jgi:hypothetical protein